MNQQTKDTTAMQELIEWMESEYKRYSNFQPEDALEKAKSLLQKEREQIEKAFKNGFYTGCDQPLFEKCISDYITQTYKQ